MKFSANGIALLKQLEGCVKHGNKHVIYDDKTGKPVNTYTPLPNGATIGYGHLIKHGENFYNGISEQQATDLLNADITDVEYAVRNNVHAQLTQNQYDALVIFAYNIGITNFTKSTVIKYINNPNFHSTCYPDLQSAWKAWNKSGGRQTLGLTHRRNQEWNLFNE